MWCNASKPQRGQDKMATIFQTTFWSGFSWMEIYEFRLKFHWSLFLGAQLTIFQLWFRLWLGANQATSHYLNKWWLVYWCIYVSLRFNELNKDAPLHVALTALAHEKWPTRHLVIVKFVTFDNELLQHCKSLSVVGVCSFHFHFAHFAFSPTRCHMWWFKCGLQSRKAAIAREEW